MFIKELELKDNARLAIRGNRHVHVKFDSETQLILGSNGSGKSTMMQELSPLPPSGNDYFKGGYKRIVIEHKGNIYTLTSVFSNQAGKHSFMTESGEELNSGGTQSVQRQLVQETFGFDDQLHELLTDQVKFTSMSPIQRRDWLTRISGTNLDFALEIFNKLKKKQREQEVLLKHFNTRLAKESEGLPSEEEIQATKTKFDALTEKLKYYHQHQVNDELKSPDHALQTVLQTLQKSRTLAETFLRIDIGNAITAFKSVEEINNKAVELSTRVDAHRSSLEQYQSEYREISSLIDEVESSADLESLQSEYNKLTQLLKDSSNELKHLTQIENAIEVFGIANSVINSLTEVISELPSNTNGYYSREKLEAANNKLTEVNRLLTNNEKFIYQLNHKKQHLVNKESVECPNCHSVFKPGVNLDDIPKIEAEIIKINNETTNLENTKSKVMQYIEECNKYIYLYKQYMDIKRQNSRLQFIWDAIDVDLKEYEPKVILTKFQEYYDDLDILASNEKYLPEIYRVEAAIAKYDSLQKDSKYSKDRLEKLELLINKTNADIIALNKEESKLVELRDKVVYAISVYNDLVSNIELLEKQIAELYKSNKKEAIGKVIDNTYLDLAETRREHQSMTSQIDIVNDTIQSKNNTDHTNNIMKLLLNEINPTTGLIAEFFTSFVSQFVDQLNIIINKVWEHQVEVLPCGIDDGGLNYKFPLRINGKTFGPQDIAKGSNSQVTIVNFAFKIVVMIYLGLEDYPLYLDELAPDLDEKHRVNIVHFVRDFVESKRCSQMFMVSHYEAGYGAFNNAQILILDSENLLEVPSSYNTHATIVRETKTEETT